MQTFKIDGLPKPQGSKTPITRGGKTWLIEAVAGVKEWRKHIVDTITEQGFTPYGRDVPVVAHMTFFLPRPKTVSRAYPTVKPDRDKLERAVNDALTLAGVWGDDSQAVTGVVRKRYADEFNSVGVLILLGVQR